ncbi:MAG: HAMP domain-containing protein [Chloroflexi bacterium]|nr:HAMP domain-containing protein [Chloroflexota bacterium]
MFLNNIKMKPKLIGLFLIVGLVPLVAVAAFSMFRAQDALQTQAYNNLEAVHEIKRYQINTYFEEREGDMGVLVETVASLQQDAFSKLAAVQNLKKTEAERYLQDCQDDMDMLVETVASLRQEAFAKLEAVQTLQKAELERYLATVTGDIQVLKDDPATVQAINDIVQERSGMGMTGETYLVGKWEGDTTLRSDRVVKEGQIGDIKSDVYIERALSGISGQDVKIGSSGDMEIVVYTPLDIPGLNWAIITTMSLEEAVAPQLEGEENDFYANYIEKYGYYDLFLINPDGYVFYTVSKESDYQTNMVGGEYSASNLGGLVRQVLETQKLSFADFEPYAPSNNEQAAFIAQPFLHNGEVEVVVALQLPVENINAITQRRQGMGTTGETYLVGKWEGVTTLRSDRVVKEGQVGDAKSGVYIERALSGISGQDVKIGSSGDMEIVIYAPLDIPGLNWAIITTMNLEEAIAPQLEGETEDFYAKYIAKYGYYDLFLINPDGYVFYTVAKEADYQTNMVGGQYANSNLGELVQEILNTKQFGFADFDQYAPSNDEAAAFIAQPLIHEGGIEVIVALQLPLEGINSIMSVREGMGESGEAYLVGPDKRMRSDSYLDPTGHSVAASFAGTVAENGADTEQVSRALAKEDGREVLNDYTGNPVLSAYGPVEAFDVTWAVMVEINEEEVNRPVTTLINAVLAIGGVAAVIVAVVAFFVALSIANPVQKIADAALVIAEGDVNQRVDINQKDEVGLLADAFRQLIVYMQEMATAATSLAQGDLTVDVTPQSNRDVLGNAFAQMIADLRNLIGQVTDSANNVSAASSQLTASADQSAQAANQVANTIQQVAQGTAQQTESVTTATTTVEQVARAIEGVARGAQEQASAVDMSAQITASISRVIQQVATNAQAGAEGATQATHAAREGAGTVQKTIQGMESIKTSTDLVAQRVREMGQRSEQIGDIVETIDGIASQTNLLALNAAIEAARAGEHGKGFAVVADEVRKLAEGSAIATKEIAGLIRSIQQTIAEAVQAMDAGAAEVELGMGQAVEAGQALDSILVAAETVNQQVEEIAAAAQQMDASANELVSAMESVSAVVEENNASTEEMAAGAGDVSQAIESIASISEENSASTEEVSATVEEVSAQVEEVTASAQSLAAMAQGLQALVAQFRLPGTGPVSSILQLKDEGRPVQGGATFVSTPQPIQATTPTADPLLEVASVESGGNGHEEPLLVTSR